LVDRTNSSANSKEDLRGDKTKHHNKNTLENATKSTEMKGQENVHQTTHTHNFEKLKDKNPWSRAKNNEKAIQKDR